MVVSAAPYHPHNHDACAREALDNARSICKTRQARLTPIRERVLELIWQSHKPLGAYDLLAELASERQNAAPPTVYRALDFLQQNGLVHRIASLNAFIGCTHAGESHHGMLLICSQCRNVLELASGDVTHSIRSAAREQGFEPQETTLEITGLCPACQTKTDP